MFPDLNSDKMAHFRALVECAVPEKSCTLQRASSPIGTGRL